MLHLPGSRLHTDERRNGVGVNELAVENLQLVDVVTRQLESMLSVGNCDAVQRLLEPVQPVDIAEAISRRTNLRAIAFRLLGQDEAIGVYEYLDTATQQSLLTRLRSGEMREVWRCRRTTGCNFLMSCRPRWCVSCSASSARTNAR